MTKQRAFERKDSLARQYQGIILDCEKRTGETVIDLVAPYLDKNGNVRSVQIRTEQDLYVWQDEKLNSIWA